MKPKEESTALLTDRNARYDTIAKSEIVASKAVFPYGSVGVLALGSFAESVTVGSVLTYSFAMVSDMKTELNPALCAGLLISAYASGVVCTSTFWVSQSGHCGRKCVFLLGLLGLSSSSLMLGFSSNYWIALAARLLGGLFNANSTLIPIMNRGVLQRSGYESAASSIPQTTWLMGHIVGCLIGGLSSRPADMYPGHFSQTGIFGRYPYLLPNIITTYLSVAAIIQGLFLLTETNEGSVSSEQTRSTINSRGFEDKDSSLDRTSIRHSTTKLPSMSVVMGQRPYFYPRSLYTVPVKSNRLSSRTGSVSTTRSTQETSFINVELRPLWMKPRNSKVVLWMITLGLLRFNEMAWRFLLPTSMLDKAFGVDAHLDLQGGLTYNLLLVGIVLAVGDVIVLVFQHIVTMVPQTRGLVLLKQLTNSLLGASSLYDSTTLICSIAGIVAPPALGMIYEYMGSAAAWWICALVATSAYTGLGFLCTIEQDPKHDCEKADPYKVEVGESDRSLNTGVNQA